MQNDRRDFIRKAGLIASATGLGLSSSLALSSEQSLQEGDRLVLLGTQGGPLVRSYKQTPSSSVIVYKTIPFVVDTGYGVTLKLKEAGINLASLRYIFITHHHSDHNLELGPLLYNAWIAGLTETIDVYGPVGLSHLLEHYLESNVFDITTRVADEGRPDIRKLVIIHEIGEGTILSDANVEVSAMKNIHPPIDQSFAYRFKFGSKTVVFSGDTAYCPALATFSKDAEYLVHEVLHPPAVQEMVKRRPNAPKLLASILSHHTSAEDVGKIATQANVKNLVLNHFVPPDDKSLTEDIWIKLVKTTFSGSVFVGKDLLALPL